MLRRSSLALVLGLTAVCHAAVRRHSDAATILQRSQERWHSLVSYQVPVAITGGVRAFIISVPFKMTGTQYYRAPDRQALHLDNPPSLARGLGNTLSTIGTPQTWLRDYTMRRP